MWIQQSQQIEICPLAVQAELQVEQWPVRQGLRGQLKWVNIITNHVIYWDILRHKVVYKVEDEMVGTSTSKDSHL